MPRPWETLLDQVVRERYPRLVAHATLVAGGSADAQDLVQEALISAFSGRARFASLPQAEAYVRRAIVSRAVDASRRRGRESRALERAGSQSLPGATVVEERGPGADVLRALGTLSPRERACVVLRQMEDLSVQETADLLRVSQGAVKRYTADGLARLGAALGTTTAPTVTATVTLVPEKEAHHER
ncbi:RNA polymerase sigma factor [Cellulomonas sp. NPDC055163]